MARPDLKIMVTQKTDNGTFYKQVGVAWKGNTKDGREKVTLELWMFPNMGLTCFPNETDEETKARLGTGPRDPDTY